MLVAGGLGERLGYSGIKLALPSDTARGACFLQVHNHSSGAKHERSFTDPRADCAQFHI